MEGATKCHYQQSSMLKPIALTALYPWTTVLLMFPNVGGSIHTGIFSQECKVVINPISVLNAAFMSPRVREPGSERFSLPQVREPVSERFSLQEGLGTSLSRFKRVWELVSERFSLQEGPGTSRFVDVSWTCPSDV